MKSADEAGLPAPIEEIPRKLRQYYDSLQNEAIPDRLLDLLEKLDQAEQAAARQASAEESGK
ncbi:NepR family anti-sigma factor [Rhizobium setariae]|nr:NepR family anti-sigma factor [Rhizobium setariae]